MVSRLRQVKDWGELAQANKYSVTSMARNCGVSTRQLERFFVELHGKSPRSWLQELRMQRALELMRDCTPVKEASYVLGYKNSTHFGHAFKKFFGISPGKVGAVDISVSLSSHVSLFQMKSKPTPARRLSLIPEG